MSNNHQHQKSSHKLRKFHVRKKWLIVGVVVIGVSIAVVSGLYINKPLHKITQTQNNQQTAIKAANQMTDQYNKDKKVLEQAPTPESTYKGLQDKITSNDTGKEQGEQFNTYSQAALLGASLKDANAKDYAVKALSLASSDKYFLDYNAGLLSKLEAISKGDYSVVE